MLGDFVFGFPCRRPEHADIEDQAVQEGSPSEIATANQGELNAVPLVEPQNVPHASSDARLTDSFGSLSLSSAELIGDIRRTAEGYTSAGRAFDRICHLVTSVAQRRITRAQNISIHERRALFESERQLQARLSSSVVSQLREQCDRTVNRLEEICEWQRNLSLRMSEHRSELVKKTSDTRIKCEAEQALMDSLQQHSIATLEKQTAAVVEAASLDLLRAQVGELLRRNRELTEVKNEIAARKEKEIESFHHFSQAEKMHQAAATQRERGIKAKLGVVKRRLADQDQQEQSLNDDLRSIRDANDDLNSLLSELTEKYRRKEIEELRDWTPRPSEDPSGDTGDSNRITNGKRSTASLADAMAKRLQAQVTSLKRYSEELQRWRRLLFPIHEAVAKHLQTSSLKSSSEFTALSFPDAQLAWAEDVEPTSNSLTLSVAEHQCVALLKEFARHGKAGGAGSHASHMDGGGILHALRSRIGENLQRAASTIFRDDCSTSVRVLIVSAREHSSRSIFCDALLRIIGGSLPASFFDWCEKVMQRIVSGAGLGDGTGAVPVKDLLVSVSKEYSSASSFDLMQLRYAIVRDAAYNPASGVVRVGTLMDSGDADRRVGLAFRVLSSHIMQQHLALCRFIVKSLKNDTTGLNDLSDKRGATEIKAKLEKVRVDVGECGSAQFRGIRVPSSSSQRTVSIASTKFIDELLHDPLAAADGTSGRKAKGQASTEFSLTTLAILAPTVNVRLLPAL